MSRHISIHLLRSAAAALLTAVFAASCLCSCQSTPDTMGAGLPEETEKEVLEEDTRAFTDEAPLQYKLSSAFENAEPTPAEQLHYTENGGSITINGYTGSDNIVVLPDEIDGLPVEAISPDAFSGSSIQALSIPDSVCWIGQGALAGCSKLVTLRTPLCTGGEASDSAYFGYLFGASSYEINASAVPRGLETLILTSPLSEIPDYAFYGCSSLVALSIPDTVTSIGDFAFASCSRLAYVSMSQSLTSVGKFAFRANSALLSLSLPASVTHMGAGMLQECTSLERITLPFVGETPTENTYVGYLFGATSYTFTQDLLPASLIEVELLDGCTTIPANAFCQAAYLRTVRVPKSCTQVGARAFYGCKRLTAAELSGVTSIGDAAFTGCESLSRLTLGDGLTTMGIQAFFDCAALTEVDLSGSLTAIPSSCFDGCTALTRITWSQNLASIGKNAFRRCAALSEYPSLDGITVSEGNEVLYPPTN